jgi:gliding motility-associated-like protein
MKKILFIITSLFYTQFLAYSQGTDCSSASAFCSGSTTYPASTNAGTAQNGPNYGCLGSQPNPAWFYMQISTPGSISLTITANPPRDIDFILYGPFTSPSAPCSSGVLTAANTEDCSYAGGTAPEVADITGGNAGEYYLMLLTNFSNQPTTVSFAQTSGTGSTSCGVLCDITNLTAVPSACAVATNTYSLSGQIAFTTQPTTGTLTVTSSCGGSQVFNAPFSSPINYNIPGITSNGATCSVTATFSATPSCTQTTSYTAPANCTPCIATANNNGPVCSSAILSLTATTVPGATSYSWTGPNGFTSNVQNPSIVLPSVAASGTYSLTVTTASAVCSSTTTAVVNQRPAPPSATNNGPVCSGSALNLNASSTGTTYSWTGPGGYTSTTQNPSISPVTNASTGTYSVTATSNGCTSLAGTTSVIINNTPNPPTPSINGSTSPAAICAGGTITLTANNIAGATYSWTGPNGYTAAVRNPPPLFGATSAMSGTYSLIVTVGGCQSTPAAVSITVNAIPAAPTAAGTTICSGASATLTATAPGGTYDWYSASTGGTLLGTGAIFTTPSLTSTTTYYVQSSNSGCVGPRTAVTVNVSPSFTVVSSADDSICFGTSTTLGVLSPTGTFTYSWSAAGAPGFSTSDSPVVTPSVTTTYTVTVTDPASCSGSDVVTITVGTPLTVTISSTDANCFASCDGSSDAAASGSFTPYSYNWSNGASTDTLSALCAGTYSVVVSDFIGCTALNSVIINEPSALTYTTASITSHCNLPDGSASITVSGGVPGYSYVWSPGGQTNDTAINLVPGNYTVIVSDAQNCQVTATVNVSNTPGVSASLSGTTPVTCNGGCDGTATILASGGTAPYTYEWSNGQTASTATALCAGSYVLTVTDATGCTAIVPVTLTQPSGVFLDALPTLPIICIGQSVTLTAQATGGTGSGYIFTWTAPSFTGNPYIVSPSDTTVYTVSAVDGNGCASQNTQSTTIRVYPPLNVSASNDENICAGNSALLSAVGSGGDGTYVYTWSPGGTGSTSPTFSASPTSTTTYTVTLTDGCTTLSATDNVLITVRPLPVINLSSSALAGCAPLCPVFTDMSTIGAGSTITGSHWDFGDGNSANTSTANNCYTNAGIYSVTLTDTSNYGCIASATINNMITVSAMPVAMFTYDPQPASINYPEVHFLDLSTNATMWEWNFGDSLLNPATNTSSASSPDHTYSDIGEYCVQLKVYNTPACVDTTTHCLIIQPDYTLYIPNAFTPDGSGINDEFLVKGENIAKFEMQIYDRWGMLVFRTDDLYESWKGTVKNGTEIAPLGVYVYVINVKDKVGEKHQYIGHVTIVK